MMTMKTKTLLTSLLLALSAVGVTARITSTSTSSSTNADIHRLLTNENPSAVCVPEKLLEHCPDESVTPEHLTQRCGGTYRLKAIRCYMEYLCENGHGQETVNSHKECMNNECAMAKRMGPLNCQEHLDSLNNEAEETTDQETTTTTNTNTEEESSTPTESTPTEEEPSTTEEESSTTEEQSTTTEEQSTAEEEPKESTTQEESGASSNNSNNNSTEEIHEDSGEINEQQQLQQQEGPKHEEQKASGGAIAFVVFAAVALAGVLYMYRGELLGKNREQFPGDSHIVANGNANLAPGQQADDDHQIT